MSDPNPVPAFPVPDTCYPNGEIQYGSHGMTLRQWYAGMALQGLIAAGFGNPDGTAAVQAVAQADALIAAEGK